jgi:glycosyltransferase involved in cell wall biosynthesis
LPDVHLAVVGDDQSEYGALLKEKAQTIAPDRIFFTGKVLNVVDYLRAADVFVLPTLNKGRQEGSPVSLLEAMACGVPVLASNVAGIRDQLNSCKELLFKPGDADALSKLLTDLFQKTTQESETLGRHLRTEVLRHLTIDTEVSRHSDFYLNVCNKL